MKGLTHDQLAAVAHALQQCLAGSTVRDVAMVRGNDDLLFYLDLPDGSRRTLHVAPGGARARITTTARRYVRGDFATGPQLDALQARFLGTLFETCEALPNERVARISWIRPAPPAHEQANLWVELFGPRGLWCVADADGTILELSRQPRTKGRELRTGQHYAPPAPSPGQPPALRAGEHGIAEATASPADLLASVDDRYTEHDLQVERQRRRDELQRALTKAIRKTQGKIQGLVRQQATAETAPDLRRTADLLLAYGHAAERGATTLTVPHPSDPDRQLDIPLDPIRRPHEQASALYDRARRLTDGVAKAVEREQGFRRELADLEAIQSALDSLADDADHSEWDALCTRAVAAKLLPASAAPTRTKSAAKPHGAKRKTKGLVDDKGRPFRQFVSEEGYTILVGKDNHQNDRLSLRVAKGNDLWLHVGAGRAGSHVVVRLPKHKSASLETMLDAGTLAVHFSKARGADRMDVTYTFAKHVRKPKGLPPGKVIPHHVKTLTVRLEADRLTRLLAKESS